MRRVIRWPRPSMLALLLLAATTSSAQTPTYVQRLELPTSDDPVGYPRAAVADPHTGEIFIADTRRNRILIFDEDGAFRHQISGGRVFSAPTDLAVDREGFLFVLANHERRRALIQLDFDGLFRHAMPLQGVPDDALQPDIASIALSPQGDRLYLLDRANVILWIADRDGLILERIELAAGMPREDKQEVILGKVDVYGDRVLVAVSSEGRVRRFDLAGNALGHVGRKGTASCQLGFPTAAAMDTEGNLVILDQQRMLFSRWDGGSGRCLGDHYGLGAAPGYLYFPHDLALDRSGRLYVTQGYEGRIQVYEGLPVAGRPPPPAEPAADVLDPRERVREVVRQWARSRSDGRWDEHLAAYSTDYLPWGLPDRAAWETLARMHLQLDEWIEVELSEVDVQLLSPDTARVRFVQSLRSNRYESRARKTLILTREDRGWRIIEERGAAIP